MTAPVFLDVIVVGGGIAGLSAAIALRRAGHYVTVFERSNFTNEVGAAISMSPNAVRVLRSWDIDPEGAMMVPLKESYMANAKTLEKTSHQSWDHCEERYGAPWYLSHRVDLHHLLRNAATREDRPGQPVKIINRSTGVSYDCAKGIVRMGDGASYQADLIIAADGVHSRAVEHVIGYSTPATDQGVSVMRTLIPTSAVLDDPETADLLEGEPRKLKQFIADRPGRRLIWYSCHGGELQNLAMLVPNDPKLGATEDWHGTANPAAFLEEVKKDYHPSILKVFVKAKEYKVWKLMQRKPLSTWFNGRVALVGDAAHAMMPYQGQGGAQAIEDSGALGVVFSAMSSKDDKAIAERLQLFQDVRIRRASAVQVMSMFPQDQGERIEQAVREFLGDESVCALRDPVQYGEFNFSRQQSVQKVSQAALEKLLATELPNERGLHMAPSQMGIAT